ncbi:MAG: ABC transporter permease subunit [Epulopiscium sp.]|jgi:NitT/TauT family transport system permease protein|nr:ABC transporter permease subunit [Candidatus Epulonipiscium sp.]
MNRSIMKNKQKKYIRSLCVALFWICVWQICYWVVGHEVLVASPFDVGKTLWKNAGEAWFWQVIFHSLLRIVKGYLFGIAIGAVAGVLATKYYILYELLYPMMSIVKASPVASFILLTLVWMKTDSIPSFISFLMVMPIMFTNVMEGLKRVDTDLLEVAQVYRWSLWKKICFIYCPQLWPYMAAAATMSLGLAWKAGVATEVIASPSFSIGHKLRDSKIYMETAELFAWTAVVIILSMLLEKGLAILLRRIQSTSRRKIR